MADLLPWSAWCPGVPASSQGSPTERADWQARVAQADEHLLLTRGFNLRDLLVHGWQSPPVDEQLVLDLCELAPVLADRQV